MVASLAYEALSVLYSPLIIPLFVFVVSRNRDLQTTAFQC